MSQANSKRRLSFRNIDFSESVNINTVASQYASKLTDHEFLSKIKELFPDLDIKIERENSNILFVISKKLS